LPAAKPAKQVNSLLARRFARGRKMNTNDRKYPDEIKNIVSLLVKDFSGMQNISYEVFLENKEPLLNYLNRRYEQVFGNRTVPDEKIVDFIYRDSFPTKFYKKYLQSCFIAVIKCFSESLERINQINSSIGPDENSKKHYFESLFNDTVLFLNDFEYFNDKEGGVYVIYRRNIAFSHEIFAAIDYHLFNYFNTKTFAGIITQPISVFLIRQAIEVRIKNALGIHIIRRADNANIVKITPDFFFDFIYSNPENIKMPITKDKIVKIHRWTNNFIHAGLMPPIYKIWFAFKQLEPLFSPGVYNNIWDISGSITIRKEYYDLSMDNDLKKYINLRSRDKSLTVDNLIIEKMDPEALLI
jgi:hypothetical protein